jgi:hypothetical protein
MTDIEAKALALVNELQSEDGAKKYSHHYYFEALCRAIEQHEAFKQEVSDALVDYFGEHLVADDGGDALASFVIPKPKPDPLVEILEVVRVDPKVASTQEYVDAIRAALEARGLEIREKGQ